VKQNPNYRRVSTIWFVALLVGSAMLTLLAVMGTPATEARAKSTPTPTPTAVPTSTVNGTWKVVPSPNGATTRNILNAVTVVAANDIWAVGTANYKTLVEHWNGSSWSTVPSPSPGTVYAFLNAVAAVSSNDVWAVGYYDYYTLIEHWDGTRWSVVPSPNQPGVVNYLTGVAVVSANDVWAVGNYSGSLTLIEHWDGKRWSIIPSPNPSSRPYNYLYGVTALSSNNVWAVGSYGPSGLPPQTLVEHWNGTNWSVVPSPNQVGSYYAVYNELDAVRAVSANDIWAVGTYGNESLTEHWDGSSWSIVSSPNVQSQQNFLKGVAPVASNDVWAVGYAQYVVTIGETEYDYPDTLIMHWNGANWSIIPSPNPSTTPYNILYGVGVVSASDIWAVGTYDYETLVERYTVP
jgi:hypothetical protein